MILELGTIAMESESLKRSFERNSKYGNSYPLKKRRIKCETEEETEAAYVPNCLTEITRFGLSEPENLCTKPQDLSATSYRKSNMIPALRTRICEQSSCGYQRPPRSSSPTTPNYPPMKQWAPTKRALPVKQRTFKPEAWLHQNHFQFNSNAYSPCQGYDKRGKFIVRRDLVSTIELTSLTPMSPTKYLEVTSSLAEVNGQVILVPELGTRKHCIKTEPEYTFGAPLTSYSKNHLIGSQGGHHATAFLSELDTVGRSEIGTVDRDTVSRSSCDSGVSSPSGSSAYSTMSTESTSPTNARYQCTHCGKSYTTVTGLSKHIQFHCTSQVTKTFVCKDCNKVYTSLGALKMHIRTHTLPCKCTLCPKSFSRPWLLQGHLRTHTGEKPFVCEHCDRAFADRSNLRAHLRTHSQAKKYSCNRCAKTFSRMSFLTKHEEKGCSAPK